MANKRGNAGQPLPLSDRDDDHMQGHWLLARLGKRVLRPGGVELTRTLLARAEVTDADVLELAPGLGRTAAEILARNPRSYVGAESDPNAANLVRHVLAGRGDVRVTDAADTGLSDASADVVIGEAMLTMQGNAAKHTIVAEAARVLRPVAPLRDSRTSAGAGRRRRAGPHRPAAVAGPRAQGQCASADRCGMVAPLSGPWTGRRTRCHRFHGVVTTATGDR